MQNLQDLMTFRVRSVIIKIVEILLEKRRLFECFIKNCACFKI